MPKTRCLSCGRLIDSRLSRCHECAEALKRDRNRTQRSFGPCPQSGRCGFPPCGLPVRPGDPFVWGHWPGRWIDGETNAVPMHKSCNEGAAKRIVSDGLVRRSPGTPRPDH